MNASRRVADVAVVIPVANRPEMLDRALRSIEAQTVAPVEVIVVDDCSLDRTPDVAIEHGAKLIRMAVNGGPGPARNAGIESATASWIAFLDSDDQWLPGHLEGLLKASDGHVLVTAPAVTSKGRVIGNPWRRKVRLSPRRIIVPVELVCTSGTMVRRDLCLAVGGFPSMRRAEDLDLWLRVLEHGPGVALSTPTVKYTYHETQVSGDTELMRDASRQVLRHYRGRSWFDSKTQDQWLAHLQWDAFRAALNHDDRSTARDRLTWLLYRPATWLPMIQLFAARRLSRYPLRG
jgi:glycosyltransferase involved in cell wall biosynthesis